MKNKKFVVIDGSSLVHRAFYALPLLTNKEGVFTNAAYGFTNMFLKVLENEQPDCVAVCFDKGKITFRNRQYKEYKGHRKKTPPELIPQFEIVKRIVNAFGIEYLELDDYEADDLIGTLVQRSEKEGALNTIITGDRDALQLVSSKTEVLLTRKGISEMEKFNVDAIKEKYGLTPLQLIDLKGLMGDQSDNIPGVPGVGEKTALKLLHEYGSIENVYENIDKLKGKLKERLIENKDLALLSRNLATIDKNAPIEINVSTCIWEGPKYENLLNIFNELEFTSLISKILKEMQDSATENKKTKREEDFTITFLETQKDLREAFKDINDKMLSVYVDLSEENYHFSKIISLGISYDDNIFSINANYISDLAPVFSEIFSKAKGILCHDAKKTYTAFKRLEIDLKNIIGDTMIAGYLLDPSASKYTLQGLSLKYLNKTYVERDDADENSAIYARIISELIEVLHGKLQEFDMFRLYNDVEIPLIKILADMELSGVSVDKKELSDMGKKLKEKIDILKQEIFEISGKEFNINSPKQLGVILFEKLKLPVIKRTKTGYSTSAEVLEELVKKHPIAEKLLLYRQLTKLLSTYVEGLQKLITKENKLHTTFNQTITATGRLSSTEPNLQNIPIRLDFGRKLRKIFRPSKADSLLLAVDYSQIELRVLAHISGDENLRDAFNKAQDIHARTASEVFNVEMSEVTSDMRRSAKAVNFGIIYGLSEFGLSRDLGISRAEAKKYINNYFRRYPKVNEYMDRVVGEARNKGFVTTLLNRRRYMPDLFSPNRNVRNAAERTAMNTPIQGSAADIIKLAMVAVNQLIEDNRFPATMLLQVHDELIFEVEKNILPEFCSKVINAMENAYLLDVPLVVDAKYGENWYELQAINL